MMKGGTSQNLTSFYFRNSWIYVETMTQTVNLPIGPVQYCACQNTQRMYKVTLIVNRVHMVYRTLNLHRGFTPKYRCVLALYTLYFPEFCENKLQAYYSVGYEPATFAILEQMSYQLDYRDCPVARGSLNPIF